MMTAKWSKSEIYDEFWRNCCCVMHGVVFIVKVYFNHNMYVTYADREHFLCHPASLTFSI